MEWATASRKRQVLYRRRTSFFPPLFAYFLDNFGLAILYPIAAPLFLKENSPLLAITTPSIERTFLLALLICTFPLAQFFGASLLGSLSDQMGRKKVFVATTTGAIGGYLITGLGLHYEFFWILLFGRCLSGFFAGNLTLCLAAISDLSQKKQNHSTQFGVIGTVGALGFILAIFTGAGLSNPKLSTWLHPEIPFFIASLLCAMNLVLLIRFFHDPHRKKGVDKQIFFDSLKCIWTRAVESRTRFIYLAYFLFMLGWITALQFLSAYLIDQFDATRIAITTTFFILAAVWAIANFIVNPILSKKLQPKMLFLIGLTLLAIFFVLDLIPHVHLTLFILHFSLATFCAALAWTNGLATLAQAGTLHSQGVILGVNQSLVSIASIVGPLVGGLLLGADIHRLYLFTATSALLGALTFRFSSGIKN